MVSPPSPQESVAKVMRSMGLNPRYEALTRDGLLSIDIAVKWRGRYVPARGVRGEDLGNDSFCLSSLSPLVACPKGARPNIRMSGSDVWI